MASAAETVTGPRSVTPGTPSPRVTINRPEDAASTDGLRPPFPTGIPDPPGLQSFASPIRQHKRTPSAHREIKRLRRATEADEAPQQETLDAHVEFTSDEADGRTYHRINQYLIMEEIGRGSYGAVHLATDQFGKEFAVKEFSKTRLRKRAQSHLLRQGPYGSPRQVLPKASRGGGPLTPQLSGLRAGEKSDALILIREEIAIMKKLNHPNLVQLIEVLDDPEEDSLYMVLEMCKKGVVMKVGLDEDADPYSDESCRYWFRDLILGIEYLHAQGVIHRDIKPDNLLLSDDEVLKVVDFGVSEMFEKSDNMRTAKSAGSPAFLPPELCGKHREVSGKAADIWSMGVSLFCLKYGRIPFNKPGILEVYEAIKTEDPQVPEDEDPVFADLLGKILDKDPDNRITMAELREHPWVTKGGSDPLLSAEENCSHLVEPPTELELSRAFTRKMNHLLCVMKAIHRFRSLLVDIRARNGVAADGSTPSLGVSDSQADFDPAEEKARTEVIEALISRRRSLLSQEGDDADKGHAHDVSDQEPLFLGIGTGARDDFAMDEATPDVVAHSPTAVDFNIYDRAYEDAVNRQMKASKSGKPTLYLTKFVKETEHFKKLENLVEGTVLSPPTLKAEIKDSKQQLQRHLQAASSGKLAQLVSRIGISDTQSPETRRQGE
ncbi:Calcium/calmodulin-dependent protein kinase kinase 1 [Tolypocladium ophioglossoides CBS 100239]|uniref:Calcium/calmodulin-dependent protein kinase kinase 1 n=1 Tax=Tolypocladium ophioglossoides (strain CBS 100239) TaxID=1163406 RepID=A0A0L0NLI9_TOLOC|nr:Calcium/calmodulin-dependent protein kinase kinase 1 [Tolypocladium ophioglossoides CBS 100239]